MRDFAHDLAIVSTCALAASPLGLLLLWATLQLERIVLAQVPAGDGFSPGLIIPLALAIALVVPLAICGAAATRGRT